MLVFPRKVKKRGKRKNMSQEIERKFLVKNSNWRQEIIEPGVLLSQGYLNNSKERTVRVRISGEQGFLTIKGLTTGISRLEFEYAIPTHDAKIILQSLCLQPILEKIRYKIKHKGFLWEVDEFLGENKGLILAEIELTSETQSFPFPSWIGDDVSHDPRYFNSRLQESPYSKWS